MATIFRFLCGVLLLAAAGILPATAQNFPNKPITLYVGYPPGASTDFSARVLAQEMTKHLGQTVLVENKPGAAAALASDFVSKSTPDGYTLLYGNTDAISLLPAVKPDVPYKIPASFTFIGRDALFPFVLAVSTKLPFKTAGELIAYAKANPGKLRYGSSGMGGTLHVAALLFDREAGIQMTHVPYRGAAPAMTDVLGGFIDLIFATESTSVPPAQAGKVRLLAVTADQREALIPDVPTMAELGYKGATMAGWFGVMGPPKMPAAVTKRLQDAIEAALKEDELAQRFKQMGLVRGYMGGAEFKDYVVKDYELWKGIADKDHIRITD